MSLSLGLMSGTSADGVDAALLEVDGLPPDGVRWALRGHATTPHPAPLRERILRCMRRGSAEDLCELHVELGEAFAAAAQDLLAALGVDVREVEGIGSHGQTFWHRPPDGSRRGATLQLGDAATVADRTGIDVVSDFRAADMAAGGQGAPLVAWPDRVLFALPDQARVLLNVGGMANLTWIPARGAPEAPVAFDCGPGNVLLDAAAGLAAAGTVVCDVDGRWASAGHPDPELLERLLEDPFFHAAPPRSTGRERFGLPLVESLARERGLVPGRPAEGWPDLLATLVRLTARTVAEAVRRWVLPRSVESVVVTGGGAKNPELMGHLAEELAPLRVVAGPRVLGAASHAREAMAFALLAWAHRRGIPGNVPSVTGATAPRVLGSLTPAPERSGR